MEEKTTVLIREGISIGDRGQVRIFPSEQPIPVSNLSERDQPLEARFADLLIDAIDQRLIFLGTDHTTESEQRKLHTFATQLRPVSRGYYSLVESVINFDGDNQNTIKMLFGTKRENYQDGILW